MGFEFGARGFKPQPRQPSAPQVQVLAPSRRQQRLYEAAIQNRLTANWVTTSTSADAEIDGSLVRARNASRQLRRDNPYYAQAIRVITNNVIGRGIRFQSRVKMQQGNNQIDSNLRRQIEAWWKYYTRKEHIHVAGKLSFARILRQCVDAAVESGEVFIRLVPEPFGDSTTPLGIEIIESDYCDEGHTTGRLSDETQWRMGVHVDKWNRPIEYRFRTSHPGDVAGSTGYKTVDIPASEIIHLYIQDRPGQTRGMPWLVAGMKRLHHLDGFEMAEVIGKRARSSLMGFIETPEPETLTDDVFAGDRVTVFEPGTFKTLAPGERVTVPQLGSDESDYEPFLRCMLRGLSAASAVPYPALSSDYSTANYSSSRLERLEVLPYWRFLQDWIVEDVCTPINERAMGAAVEAGTLPLVGYETMFRRYQECRWYPRGWEYVNPAEDVKANKESVRAGFTTQTAIVAESYGDIEEMMDERQQELAMAQARGIILDTNPGQVSNAGLTQARPPGSIIPQDPWAPSDTAAETGSTDSTDSLGEVEDTPEDTAEDAAEGEVLS